MRFFLMMFLLVKCASSDAQELLVNGNFEEENTCSEYDALCAPEAWISAGAAVGYVKDPRRAFSGRFYIEFAAGHELKPFQRSGFRTRLICALRKGQIYRLTLRVKSNHPVLDSIGVYFGERDPLLERKPIHRLAPSLFFGSANQFVNDTSWQQVVLEYKALGDERYLFLANYSVNDVNQAVIHGKNKSMMVAVDAVSLAPVDGNESFCADAEESREAIYYENARHQMLTRSLRETQAHTPLPLIRPQATQVVRVEKIILPDVLFASSKKELLPGSQLPLDSICRTFAGKAIDSLMLTGHTDNKGSLAGNEELAVQRAQSVAAALRNCTWLSRKPVMVRGAAAREPVASNDNPEGRAKNRRVELIIYTRD